MRLEWILGGVGIWILGVVAAALSGVLANESKAWVAYFPKWIVRHAVARLPKDQRERYAEEWQSHINEVPGDIGKIVSAVEFVFAAKRMPAKTAKKRYPIFKLHGDIPVRVSADDKILIEACRVVVRTGITTAGVVKVRLESPPEQNPPSTQG